MTDLQASHRDKVEKRSRKGRRGVEEGSIVAVREDGVVLRLPPSSTIHHVINERIGLQTPFSFYIDCVCGRRKARGSLDETSRSHDTARPAATRRSEDVDCVASSHEASGRRDYQQLNTASLAGSKSAHGG